MVLDPNVLISAILSKRGAPAELVRLWQQGEFELIISRKLVTELARTLTYPKLRKLVPEDAAVAFVSLIQSGGSLSDDTRDAPVSSRDPGDDYLLALASSCDAILVSGDDDLLVLKDLAPIESPREFLDRLSER